MLDKSWWKKQERTIKNIPFPHAIHYWNFIAIILILYLLFVLKYIQSNIQNLWQISWTMSR